MENWRLSKLISMHEEDPSDDFVQFALAQEYQKLGQIEKALSWYQNLKANNPGYVGLYYHLGGLLADKGEVDQAIEIYNQGIDVARNQNDQHALSELQNVKMNLELEL